MRERNQDEKLLGAAPRTTQFTPLIQSLHDIGHMPDFELDSLVIIGVPNLKCIDGPLDVGLGMHFFHLDA